MIEVNQVFKNYGSVKAVNNVSFSMAESETLILLGTSGCGKTTTLRLLNKLEEPSAGTIYLNKQSISDIRPEQLRRRMGYVLQHTGLFPHYTVAENMAIVPRLLKWQPGRIQERARELLHKLHLAEDYLELYPDQLSGGQQQRVGLARALMADPPVLLLDEPFGALDPITRSHIRQEFLHLDELKRKTIIMVTHDVTEAFELGDRICLMDQGRIEQIGTPKELLFQPKSNYVRSFLKEQQLPLELKTLTLADIGFSGIQNTSASWSIWDALAVLLPQRNSLDSVLTTNENLPASHSPEIDQLLKALQNFRKS